MLFHDYWSEAAEMPPGCKAPFTGVKLAVDEFFHELPEKVVQIGETTHAFIVKK